MMFNKIVSGISLLCLANCSGASGDSNGDDNVGTAIAEIKLAPNTVKCLQIVVAGTTTVTKNIGLVASQSSLFALDNLPLGSDTFSASAFNVACPPAGSPSWVSDPVSATVSAAAPVSVAFTMRPAGTAGRGNVSVDFQQTHGVITEFALPSGHIPRAIVAGPDGNLWFTESGTNRVGKITPTGTITEFVVATGGSGLCAGQDGALWFPEAAPTLGRITTSGSLSERTFTGSLGMLDITTGPDGNLWVLDPDTKRIWTGAPATSSISFNLNFFTIPKASNGNGSITAGPDGNVWYASGNSAAGGNGVVARVNTSTLAITETTIVGSGQAGPTSITPSSDGNIWVTVNTSLVRVTTASTPVATAFVVSDRELSAVTTGPDGNLWFTDRGRNRIGTVPPTTGGTLATPTTYFVPTFDADPIDIVSGPDGNLWFTENLGGKIGRITP